MLINLLSRCVVYFVCDCGSNQEFSRPQQTVSTELHSLRLSRREVFDSEVHTNRVWISNNSLRESLWCACMIARHLYNAAHHCKFVLHPSSACNSIEWFSFCRDFVRFLHYGWNNGHSSSVRAAFTMRSLAKRKILRALSSKVPDEKNWRKKMGAQLEISFKRKTSELFKHGFPWG